MQGKHQRRTVLSPPNGKTRVFIFLECRRGLQTSPFGPLSFGFLPESSSSRSDFKTQCVPSFFFGQVKRDFDVAEGAASS